MEGFIRRDSLDSSACSGPQNDRVAMKTYSMTETAKVLGVHRQTMINWIRKGWVKPKRDYKDWPVFTDECIAKIKEWRETLKEE